MFYINYMRLAEEVGLREVTLEKPDPLMLEYLVED